MLMPKTPDVHVYVLAARAQPCQHVGGNLYFSRWRFQWCFASVVFASSAAAHYWINQSFAKASCACAVVKLRSNLPCAIISRAWGRLQVWRCVVGGSCVACCRALLDKPEAGASFVRPCGRVLRGCTCARLCAYVSCRLAQAEYHSEA